MCRDLARQADVELVIDGGGGEPISVIGDAAYLQQALVNLLTNAIKFSPRGGQVILSVGSDQTHAIFAVRDFGPGISEEFRPRIFGRLRASRRRDARRMRGTGLGLSLVKAIVERHDGLVGFDSPLADGGTRFWLKLPRPSAAGPLAESRVPDRRAGAGHTAMSGWKRRPSVSRHPSTAWSIGGHRPCMLDKLTRILYVDDDADIRTVAVFALEAVGGFEVAACASGREALAAGGRFRPAASAAGRDDARDGWTRDPGGIQVEPATAAIRRSS